MVAALMDRGEAMSEPLDASRCYGRALRGQLECPQCTNLLSWPGPGWNSVMGTMQCKRCGRVWIIGLLVWESVQTGRPDRPPPNDHYSLRSAAASRAGAMWMRQMLPRRGALVNKLVTSCTCAPLPWRLDCPVHGGQVGGDSGGESGEI